MRRQLARLLRMMEMRRSEETNERDAVSGEWQREEDTLATMHLSIRVRRLRLVPRTVALAPTRQGPMDYGQVWHTPVRSPRAFSASPVTALSCSALLRPLGWRLNQCVSIKNWLGEYADRPRNRSLHPWQAPLSCSSPSGPCN